jgi:uncharacterized protein
MAGISFSGITQLFVAGTRPPHLAAIAPMSVTDDLHSGLGYPGRILNIGFPLAWLRQRMSDARPAPAGGQPYARALIEAGDKRCRANQRLRLQTQTAIGEELGNPFRTPSLYARRAPGAWLRRARVPTFLVGQFQDEQTGGHFAESLPYLDRNPRAWISLQNVVHVDSLSPSNITRWVEFLKLYVAGEVPSLPPFVLGPSGAALGGGEDEARSDRPLEGAQRRDRRRTYVHVDGLSEPVVTSRSERAILADVEAMLAEAAGIPRRRRTVAAGQESLLG